MAPRPYKNEALEVTDEEMGDFEAQSSRPETFYVVKTLTEIGRRRQTCSFCSCPKVLRLLPDAGLLFEGILGPVSCEKLLSWFQEGHLGEW